MPRPTDIENYTSRAVPEGSQRDAANDSTVGHPDERLGTRRGEPEGWRQSQRPGAHPSAIDPNRSAARSASSRVTDAEDERWIGEGGSGRPSTHGAGSDDIEITKPRSSD